MFVCECGRCPGGCLRGLIIGGSRGGSPGFFLEGSKGAQGGKTSGKNNFQ